jgi:hypothetical protein
MWDVVLVFVAAHSIEAQVSNVVLATGIEAAADLDSKIFDSLIEAAISLSEAPPQFASQTPGR